MSAYNKYRSLIPTFMVKNAIDAIEFYKKIFNAKELYRLDYNDKIMHAELLIGDSLIMLSDEMDTMTNDMNTITNEMDTMTNNNELLSSQDCTNNKRHAISMYIYVEDVDNTFKDAIQSGSKVYYPLQNHFYGDRMGSFIDPFGILWSVATHIENVTNEEIKRRLPIAMDKMNQADKYKQKYYKYKTKYINFKKQN